MVERAAVNREVVGSSPTSGAKCKTFYFQGVYQCDSLARQIDALVYQLYGLTDDEIKIVESNS